jgi:hypothetical protein
VAELHDDVSHSRCVYSPDVNDDASAPLTVCSPTPKFRPETVTEYPPDIAKFGCSVNDDAGASKLKIGLPVPDTEATVTLAAWKTSPTGFDRHASVVADVHDDVKHTPRSPTPPRSSAAVAVCSTTPKSSPDTVKDAYPLCGAFCSISDTTAASKLKTDLPVPVTAATVMLATANTSTKAAPD